MSRREKIKCPKELQYVKDKMEKIKEYYKSSYEHTQAGLIIISLLLSTAVMLGIIRSLLCPWMSVILCTVISAVVTVIVIELLGLAVRIVFGTKKRNRVYWFFQFVCITIATLVASLTEYVLADVIFSLFAAICAGIFGRSVWALLRNRKHNPLILTNLIGTTVILAAIGVFLGTEGFTQKYIQEDLSLAKDAAVSQMKQEQRLMMEPGTYPVESLTYGMSSDVDQVSRTTDLSLFVERSFLNQISMKHYFGFDLSKAPLAGKMWFPVDATQCPVLFIVHGNHNYTTPSYLGYEYLAEYLASYGYVVVSVDENSCNGLWHENDGRAVLLLENIKFLLEKNKESGSPWFGKLNEDQIAIAGHSRGGEAVSAAYLLNGYDTYPDNGTAPLNYHFNIQSVIAIAPTVDQYQPAEHEVTLWDVNFLAIQGANDHDIATAMVEKQYSNVRYTGEGDYIKSMLYIAGANHGQFNTEWGRYDSAFPVNYFLNVATLMDASNQQTILKTYIKTFLDVTLKDDNSNAMLLKDYAQYSDQLPETVYQQIYETSHFTCLSDFEEDSNLNTATMEHAVIGQNGMKEWKEKRRTFGNDKAGENYVLEASWEDTDAAQISFTLPETDLNGKSVVFNLADANEVVNKNAKLLDGTVTVADAAGHTASARISENTVVYPTLPVKLRKLDFIFGNHQFKHQFQTVTIHQEAFRQEEEPVDWSQIVSVRLTFDYDRSGKIQLDHIGFESEK